MRIHHLILFFFGIMIMPGCSEPDPDSEPLDYIGTWTQYHADSINWTDTVRYEYFCKANITRHGNELNGTITNDSTKEVLVLGGKTMDMDDSNDYYLVHENEIDSTHTANIGQGDLIFARDRSHFRYITFRNKDEVVMAFTRK